PQGLHLFPSDLQQFILFLIPSHGRHSLWFDGDHLAFKRFFPLTFLYGPNRTGPKQKKHLHRRSGPPARKKEKTRAGRGPLPSGATPPFWLAPAPPVPQIPAGHGPYLPGWFA